MADRGCKLQVFEKDFQSEKATKKLLRYKIKRTLLRTGITRSKEFMLVPVVWSNGDNIKKLADYYERHRPKFENTSIPVCFVPFTDPEGKPVYKFGSIDTLFENAAV